MPGPSREIILRLYRDALSTPWGFRLQGGKDIKQPLSVQKVNVGSPVDGELCRGDVILEIQNCDATAMTHQKAQDMIKNSGGSLLLRVRRSGYNEPQQPGPAPAGLAIPPGQQGFMLQRIQDTLSTVKLDSHDYGSSAASYYDNQPLSYRPNDHHHHLFTQPTGQKFTSAQNATPRSSKYTDRRYTTLPKPKNTPQLPLGLSEPGWTPNLSIQRAPITRTGRPRTYTQPPPPTSAVGAFYDRPRSLEPERPAWEGSLRSSFNPHLTDMRVDIQPHGGATQQTQIAHFSPSSESPGQRHGSPWAQDSLQGPGPRAVNLQYNSPLALYSKATAAETLHGQTFGNAQVRSESDVYSLVHENDRRSRNAVQAHNHEAFDTSFTDF